MSDDLPTGKPEDSCAVPEGEMSMVVIYEDGWCGHC